MANLSRRGFIRYAVAAAPALALYPRLAAEQAADPWARAGAIVRAITVPTFPSRDFDITTFGAVGDGQASCTQAIGRAIAACTAAGGGRVIVPEGRFLTGAVRLESNVNLHLADTATVAFTDNPQQYPRVFTRWEGVELMNFSPFIYAFEAENLAITGRGTLDGQADESHWPGRGIRDATARHAIA
jgi:polygalacturonase